MERLYRSQKNRVIAGVAGGLGEYFGVDVVLVRLLWVLSVFLGGGGIFVYIVAWVIIPEEGRAFVERGRRTEGDRQRDADAADKGLDDGGTAVEDNTGQWSSASAGDGATETDWDSEKDEMGARRRRHAGLILVGLGIVFLAYQLFGPLFRFTWPLLLVALGFYLLFRERREG